MGDFGDWLSLMALLCGIGALVGVMLLLKKPDAISIWHRAHILNYDQLAFSSKSLFSVFLLSQSFPSVNLATIKLTT